MYSCTNNKLDRFINNKTSFVEKIEFIPKYYFPKPTNITTKLKWKLFTKVIREPSRETWGLVDRKSN